MRTEGSQRLWRLVKTKIRSILHVALSVRDSFVVKVKPLISISKANYQLKQFYVYIMSSANRVLYIGVTNNLERRIFEHKNKLMEGFTAKYNVTKLVYLEETSDVRAAIEREKQLKGWKRARKIALIEDTNPNWDDLSLSGR